jgi:hypothetical protein
MGDAMSKCRVCEGRAQLWLCTVHESILRETLRDLPWWLARLGEAAVGNVHMSDNGRRGTHANELDEYTGRDGAGKLADALEAERFRRDKVLAAGRVNAKASRLYARARNEITTWVRHLCEKRGIDAPRPAWPPLKTVHLDFIGPLPPGWLRVDHNAMPPDPTLGFYIRWLEKNAHAIAGDEAAEEIYNTFVDLTARIRRAVNRADPHTFCGPCPTLLTEAERAKLLADGGEDREECHIRLYAPAKADHVTCPRCGLEYDVKELQAWCWDNSGDHSFTLVQLCHTVLPPLGHVMKHRTLQRFVRDNRIMATGYRAHVPTYQLAQVRDALEKRLTSA